MAAALTIDRYSFIAQHVARDATVLDVGCRDGRTRAALPGRRYTGADMAHGPGVDMVADLATGLPCPCQCFDAVLALDVVEHTEDMLASLRELARVARRTLIVMLPNMANLWYVRELFCGGRLNAKYDLTSTGDRHRWLTTLYQADDMMADFAKVQRFSLGISWITDTPKKHRLGLACQLLGLPAHWWVWTMAYVMER